MKRILLLLFLFSSLASFGQDLESKIFKLLELDGTLANLEYFVGEVIDSKKDLNFGISNAYWEALTEKVWEKSKGDLKSRLSPVYSEVFTEAEIDELLKFFESETGEMMVSKQEKLQEALSLALIQWNYDLDDYILEEIDNRGSSNSTSEEVAEFELGFKNEYGLQILNMDELAIDNENNVGSLLVDFGKSDGLQNETRIIRVQNNTNEPITFEDPIFLIDDNFIIDWGDEPISVGEIRDIKIILNASKVENSGYRYLSLRPSNGTSIPLGIKYDLPQKEIAFEFSTTRLDYKKLRLDYSEPYVFVLKNTGPKDFKILDVKPDKPIVYLNYERAILESGDETTISLVFSKALIEAEGVKKVALKLNVDISRATEGHFSSFKDETIELTID